MAYGFLQKGITDDIDIDVEHNGTHCGATVVESFIARKGDPDFILGAWVAGVHVPDITIWESIKSGELNGLA